jgi:hypothetical protein
MLFKRCLCRRIGQCVMCASLATVISFETAAHGAGAGKFDLDQPHRGQVAFNAFAGTGANSVFNNQVSFPAAAMNATEGEDFSVTPASDRHLVPKICNLRK